MKYQIRRGGTLRNVANLYKIHHHEIISLNPGVDPDADLPAASQVVVFESGKERSLSIGHPHGGSLSGGLPMVDGPGRVITAQRWKTWGTRHTVDQLDSVLRRWAKDHPNAPKVLVGNLSARAGGPLSPHKTHQSGRDVDLSYIAKWDGESEVTWQHMGPDNLDAQRTWDLLRLLVKQADIDVIFIDRSLQKVLLAHARRTGTIRKARLPRWLEVAGKKGDDPWIKHVPGHKDHIHVRFSCSSSQTECR